MERGTPNKKVPKKPSTPSTQGTVLGRVPQTKAAPITWFSPLHASWATWSDPPTKTPFSTPPNHNFPSIFSFSLKKKKILKNKSKKEKKKWTKSCTHQAFCIGLETENGGFRVVVVVQWWFIKELSISTFDLMCCWCPVPLPT